MNATDPDSTRRSNFAQSIANPRQRTNLSPRIDWAFHQEQHSDRALPVLSRYGNQRLASAQSACPQAITPKAPKTPFQISDTQVIGTKIVNETRFQYQRDNNLQNPTDTNPAVSRAGQFYGRGHSEGKLNDLQNSYELQNYTSLIHGNHTLKFGGRVRATHDTNYSTSGFNGTFTFLPTTGPFTGTQSVSTQDHHRLPTASVTYFDVEPYVQDDWKVRPNFTLSSGLRFETQNAIHDHGDWAPRLGFAWGVRRPERRRPRS